MKQIMTCRNPNPNELDAITLRSRGTRLESTRVFLVCSEQFVGCVANVIVARDTRFCNLWLAPVPTSIAELVM
jgi:hypothetical protein